MIRFVRIIRDAVTWPVRHAVISILIVCLSIAFTVAYVLHLKTMRILYYQGDQLRRVPEGEVHRAEIVQRRRIH